MDKNKNALIIERNQTLIHEISKLIGQFGFDVDISSTAHEGIKKIDKKRYELIITNTYFEDHIDGNIIGKHVKIRFPNNDIKLFGISRELNDFEPGIFTAMFVEPLDMWDLYNTAKAICT